MEAPARQLKNRKRKSQGISPTAHWRAVSLAGLSAAGISFLSDLSSPGQLMAAHGSKLPDASPSSIASLSLVHNFVNNVFIELSSINP